MAFVGTIAGAISARGGSGGNQDASIWSGNNFHRRLAYSTYTGASGGTYTIMKYGRHWWGVGACHIHIHETWYGPSASYGHFLIHGHTRSGNPTIGTIYNTGIGTPYPADYDSSNERCNIKFDHSSYRRFTIMCINIEAQYVTSDSNVGIGNAGGANSWHMYNSTEII
jgi:hypothetical protein